MMCLLTAILFVTASCGPVQSQQTLVDFSGKWTMVPGSNQPPSSVRVGVGGLGEVFTVVQTATTLTITNTLPVFGDTTMAYKLDGSESRNSIKLGSIVVAERVSTVSWERGAFLIRSSVTLKGEAAKTLQTWRLDAGDLVVEQTSDAGNRKESTSARYRRN